MLVMQPLLAGKGQVAQPLLHTLLAAPSLKAKKCRAWHCSPLFGGDRAEDTASKDVKQRFFGGRTPLWHGLIGMKQLTHSSHLKYWPQLCEPI